MARAASLEDVVCIPIKLLIENKLLFCALGNLHYKISREKFEPEMPGKSGIRLKREI